MNESDPEVRELTLRVGEIEHRLELLERRFGDAPPEPARAEAIEPAVEAEQDTTAWIAVIGRALLGIAGAYLLRAAAEHRLLPLAAAAVVGLVYASAWLVAAVRAQTRTSSIVNASTAVAILTPLLWETTVRFHALPDWIAALVIIAFIAFAFTISWGKNLEVIALIGALSAIAMAIVLLFATDDLLPFTVALLAIAAAVETSACLDHWLHERWIVALAADLGVVLLTYVVATGRFPEGIAPISVAQAVTVQSALLAIYLASAITRTLVRETVFTVFESGQCIAAFLLCMGGALEASHRHPVAIAGVAAVSLASSISCYVVAFVFLDRKRAAGRNFYIYSSFALVLALAGTGLILTGATLALVWSAVGCISLFAGRKFGRNTLSWHGSVTLAAAAVITGLAAWIVQVLLTRGGSISAPAATWICAIAILVAYALSSKGAAVSLLGSMVAAALFSAALMAICRTTMGEDGAGALCATLQTFAMTLISAGLAWYAKHTHRLELAWLIVPFLIAAAYKIVVNDLPRGETLSLFASLLFYGGTLVLVPRILQHRAMK